MPLQVAVVSVFIFSLADVNRPSGPKLMRLMIVEAGSQLHQLFGFIVWLHLEWLTVEVK